MKNEVNYIPDYIFFKPTKQYFVKADNDFLSSLRSTSYFFHRSKKQTWTDPPSFAVASREEAKDEDEDVSGLTSVAKRRSSTQSFLHHPTLVSKGIPLHNVRNPT